MHELESEITALFAAGAAADRDRARDVFTRLRAALSAGEVRAAEPDAAAPSGWRVNAWVKQGILLGFRFGQVVDASADHGRWPFFDKDTLPLKRLRRRRGRPDRAGRIDRARRRVSRPRRRLHAADVHQHRRVRRRRDARRLARARRLVRAGRPPRAHQRRRADRRRARAGRRAPGRDRGRCARGGKLRGVRRGDREAPRGAGVGDDPDRLDPASTICRTAASSSRPADPSSFPKGPSSCPGRGP